jgi:predicted metallopeptidase
VTTLNLTAVLEEVIRDLVSRVEELAHIDPRRLLVAVARSRDGSRHRIFARIHPLRFPGGDKSRLHSRGRQRYLVTMPDVRHRGEEVLYLIYFHVPRFFELSFRERLVTIIHELYHISPDFDGTIRRFPGRNHAHGPSRARYDRMMAALADHYLAANPPLPGLAILGLDHEPLRLRFPTIIGRTQPPPRLAVTRLSN